MNKIVNNALFVGAAAYLTRSMSFTTAIGIGATYSIVDHVSRPFFKENGVLSIIFNVIATTGIVNHFAKLSLTVGKVTYINFLPILLVFKIIIITLTAFCVLGAINKQILKYS